MIRDYVYDHGFADERKRLSAIESLWDPGSHALIDELGIGSGWRCLEAGAGGGSIVQWMVDRGTSVLAIDIDTRFVEPLASDVVEVRRVDLRTDALPQNEFDLVHARLVLEHIADRRQVLDRLVATLRPGGWIVIEDYDWSCFGFEGDSPGFGDIADVVFDFMAKAGFERDYGRRVVSDIEAAGLTDIRGEGRARLIGPTSPGFDFFRLSFESLRGAIVDAGLLTDEEADAATAGFSQNVRLLTPMMMAGIGRKA